MSRDFSLQKYEELCEAIIGSGYHTSSVRDFILSEKPNIKTIIVRHDVDRCPTDALNMAHIESNLGISATYYFRTTPNVFKPNIIKAISEMGHEIGYHYETLAQTGGDYGKAIKLFEASLEKFRNLAAIDTISMHGRPFSKWDSRCLWDKFSFKDYGILAEAYLSIDYHKVSYLCDTGRSWDSQRFNIRDKVSHASPLKLKTTNDLMKAISSNKLDQACISCHPNRWPKDISGWMVSWLADWCTNIAKLIISRWHSK